MASGIDVVVKIGSMALIRKRENDIDYNIISRLAGELRPGMILVSSGATEIGRLDYIKRVGRSSMAIQMRSRRIIRPRDRRF